MKYSFLDCLTGHTVQLAHLIFSKPIEILVLEATSKLQGGWWEEFPAVLLNPLQTQANSAEMCVVMLQDYILLPRTSFTNCTTKLLQHLKVTSSNDGFPLWQKSDQCGSFSILKIQFLWPMGQGHYFQSLPTTTSNVV